MPNFMKHFPVGAELFHANRRTDGRTDRHTWRRKIAFRNTANALKTFVFYFGCGCLILYLLFLILYLLFLILYLLCLILYLLFLILYLLFLILYLLFLISLPEPQDAQFRRPLCFAMVYYSNNDYSCHFLGFVCHPVSTCQFFTSPRPLFDRPFSYY